MHIYWFFKPNLLVFFKYAAMVIWHFSFSMRNLCSWSLTKWDLTVFKFSKFHLRFQFNMQWHQMSSAESWKLESALSKNRGQKPKLSKSRKSETAQSRERPRRCNPYGSKHFWGDPLMFRKLFENLNIIVRKFFRKLFTIAQKYFLRMLFVTNCVSWNLSCEKIGIVAEWEKRLRRVQETIGKTFPKARWDVKISKNWSPKILKNETCPNAKKTHILIRSANTHPVSSQQEKTTIVNNCSKTYY